MATAFVGFELFCWSDVTKDRHQLRMNCEFLNWKRWKKWSNQTSSDELHSTPIEQKRVTYEELIVLDSDEETESSQKPNHHKDLHYHL